MASRPRRVIAEEAGIMEPWRRLALAAALNVTVGVGVAAAQTVIVKSAPPGSAVELVLNAATIGSAKVGPAGDARLTGRLGAGGAETADVQIYVDVCGDLRRVVLVERGLQPPPQGDVCSRREMTGVFLVRQVTTLVVDVGGPNPVVWLRQGPVPKEWLEQGSASSGAARTWRPLPTGLVLFGGGGLVKFSKAVSVFCGNVEPCPGDDTRGAFTIGGTYWMKPFLAVEGSYLKPAAVTASGSGDTYRFSSSLDADIVNIVGKVGIPLGPARLYGQAGMSYHRATSSTTETIDDVTVTIGGVATTIPGGTQTFELRTGGWGWTFGGGLEIWVVRRLALYVEAGRAALKGSARDGSEGSLDDRVTFILAGARVSLGR